MAAGRKRYIERRHKMGLKAPGGRLPGRDKIDAIVRLALAVAEEAQRWIEAELRERAPTQKP